MKASQKRDANLDLLRITSMLLIVFLHSIDHSGVLEMADIVRGGVKLYVSFAYAMCQVCVNCYVMLSGYYLVKSEFRLQKLLVLWMEVVFYSFTLKLLFMLTGREAFSELSLLSCFAPFLTGRYWFITIYVGLYLVFPFLNKLVYAMGKKEHALLNACLFVLFSLSISIYPAFKGMNSGNGWGLAWFVVLYLVAAWLRLYYTPSCKPAVLLAAFAGIPLLMSVGQACADVSGVVIFQRIISNWYRYDSVPVYLMTLAIFAAFLNIRIENRRIEKAVCSAAPLTLGVYLIHAHADVSPWLWEMLDLPRYMGRAWFPLLQLGCVLTIYVLCTAIDAARKITVGKLEKSEALNACCKKIETEVKVRLLRDGEKEKI